MLGVLDTEVVRGTCVGSVPGKLVVAGDITCLLSSDFPASQSSGIRHILRSLRCDSTVPLLPVPGVDIDRVRAKTCLKRMFLCLDFSQEICTVRQLMQGCSVSHFRCRSDQLSIDVPTRLSRT